LLGVDLSHKEFLSLWEYSLVIGKKTLEAISREKRERILETNPCFLNIVLEKRAKICWEREVKIKNQLSSISKEKI